MAWCHVQSVTRRVLPLSFHSPPPARVDAASSASATEASLKPPEVLPPVVRTQLDQISGILESDNIAEAKATLKQSYESLLAVGLVRLVYVCV